MTFDQVVDALSKAGYSFGLAIGQMICVGIPLSGLFLVALAVWLYRRRHGASSMS